MIRVTVTGGQGPSHVGGRQPGELETETRAGPGAGDSDLISESDC
jgi:hypothetical protein